MTPLKTAALLLAYLVSTNSGKAQAGTYMAGSYAGADASMKINACITAVIAGGGGTCDASSFTGTQKMSTQISLGSPASVSKEIGVTLILPESAVWIWRMSDPSGCGIYQYSSTSLVSHQTGGGGSRMVLAATAPSDMDALYCTDSNVNYVHAEGFAIKNEVAGNVFANGIAHVRNVVDNAVFERIFASNYFGDVWHVESACCGTTFEGVQGTSDGTEGYPGSGGVPLTLGPGSVNGVSFKDCNFNAPGIGHPDILTLGESAVRNVSFFNLYMEGNGSVDPTTPMIEIGGYAGPVHFFGGIANTEQSSNASTKYVFQNKGFLLDVQGMGVVNTKLGVQDLMSRTTTPVWDYSGNLGVIAPYTTAH